MQNSLFNSALKQSQSIQKDLSFLAISPATSSPALQGQISASLTSLQRTVDDYDALARRELIPAKQEKAFMRIKDFRKELAEAREQFETLKTQRGEVEHSELLGRRSHSSATPENPYADGAVNATARSAFSPAVVGARAQMASSSREEHAFRERDFGDRAGVQLDEFLERGRNVLGDLASQRETLKSTQRKLYTVANTLGISRDTIRMIERRANQDKWIFYTGVILFFVFCYFVVRWLR